MYRGLKAVAVKLKGLPVEQRRVARRALIYLLRKYRVPFTIQYRGWRVNFDVDDTRKIRQNLEKMKKDVENAVRCVAKGLRGFEQNIAIIADTE